MPVLKHAKKKLRQDVKRTLDNKRVKDSFKRLLKQAKANPTKDAVVLAVKAVDMAAKKNVIHENKAARLKSSLSKVVSGKGTKAPVKTVTAKQAAAKKRANKVKSSAKKK